MKKAAPFTSDDLKALLSGLDRIYAFVERCSQAPGLIDIYLSQRLSQRQQLTDEEQADLEADIEALPAAAKAQLARMRDSLPEELEQVVLAGVEVVSQTRYATQQADTARQSRELVKALLVHGFSLRVLVQVRVIGVLTGIQDSAKTLRSIASDISAACASYARADKLMDQEVRSRFRKGRRDLFARELELSRELLKQTRLLADRRERAEMAAAADANQGFFAIVRRWCRRIASA